MKSETPVCPLCSHHGHFILQERDLYLGAHPELVHSLYHCGDCDLYFASPIPTELLKEFYPLTYYSENGGNVLHTMVSWLRLSNRVRAVEWRTQRGRALDIGCGHGALLLELARRGWDVAGTDWNTENATAVSTRLGIRVEGGENAMGAFADSSFDVVSMLHVLEHDERPLDLLREVHRVLKPDGRLLVAVPNARSAARKLFGRNWIGYDLPRHRCTFTPHSLGHALHESGFLVDRLSGRLSDEALDVHRSIGILLRAGGADIPIVRLTLDLLAFSLLYPARLFGFYSVMYGYAKKLQ